jgi:hypothetical protein
MLTLRHIWAEIWSDINPLVDKALAGRRPSPKTCRFAR